MISDLKSYKILSANSISYTGEIKLIPLEEYNALIRKIKQLEDKVEELEAKNNKTLDDYHKEWLESHKGMNKGCGDWADALIIAKAIQGVRTKDIMKMKFPYRKPDKQHKKKFERTFSREKIFSALRISSEADKERVKKLYKDGYFNYEGISYSMLCDWLEQRYEVCSKRVKK